MILASVLIWNSDAYVNFFGYLILMTLPIIWLLGLLPPFEVLLLWIIEQTQIIIFGGTSRHQSFTSLMEDLHQDITRVSSFSRCLYGIFP